MPKRLVSIITPVLNEAENIERYYDRVCAVINSVRDQYDFEIIFTDNCSSDETFALVRDIAKKDKRVRGYRFSRNFGYQNSIFTGFSKSKGNAVVELDCDLQDPPEMILDFLSEWEKGFKIVYGIRDDRKEGWLITSMRKLFYRTIHNLSDVDLPLDAGDFMLIDRKVIDHVLKVNDSNLYIRGLVFSLGFQRKGLPYSRESRLHGETKFSLRRLISFAFDGIINMTSAPLKIASYAGILVAFVTLIISGVYIFLRLSGSVVWPAGFTTGIVVSLFGISLNALFLGIIGEYIGRLVRQSRNMPRSIIEEVIE